MTLDLILTSPDLEELSQQFSDLGCGDKSLVCAQAFLAKKESLSKLPKIKIEAIVQLLLKTLRNNPEHSLQVLESFQSFVDGLVGKND
jgi:hypothetical protein